MLQGKSLPWPSSGASRVVGFSLMALGCTVASCGHQEPLGETAGVKVAFELDGAWDRPETFFAFPTPSDLRVDEAGRPNLSGYPHPPAHGLVKQLVRVGADRRGFPVVPVAYFDFEAPIAHRDPDRVVQADKDAPLLLVDLQEAKLLPLIASTLGRDRYARGNVLALAPRPGIVLAGGRRYAFVVSRRAGDERGTLLGVPLALEQLKAGQTPDGRYGAAAKSLYEPLWPLLRQLGVDLADVAAATVFTTGDPVADLAELTDQVVSRHRIELTGLKLDPSDGDHPRYCELLGTVRYPQFQRGKPPYNTEGLFSFDRESGALRKQGEEIAPVVVTIPKAPMPAGGYPLLVFMHGSGGVSAQVVDRGPRVDGQEIAGEGPAHVVAAFGIGAAASALPLNPERLPGAKKDAYLNFANLGAYRDTHRQGVIEARLFIDAMLRLEIAPDSLAGCAGPSLPAGEHVYRFSRERLALMGQSMGGGYANMTAAVEPRVGAVVPTGAGGLWSYFVVRSQQVPNALLNPLLQTSQPLSLLHPAIHALQLAWEPVDPILYAARLSRWPLPGHHPRNVYQPVGLDDSYFPTEIMDAMALAYGNEQAGVEIWPTMQQALQLSGRAGIVDYPVEHNLTAEGQRYTGVVVQFADKKGNDTHAIAFNFEAVKHQYGCFLASYFARGKAKLPAPAPLGTPCDP